VAKGGKAERLYPLRGGKVSSGEGGENNFKFIFGFRRGGFVPQWLGEERPMGKRRGNISKEKGEERGEETLKGG